MEEIDSKMIEKFSKKYAKNKDNKSVEREIKINGIDNFCINKKIIEENPFHFNVDLGDTNRYNQKNSLRCWAFSGINVIERNMAVNMDMDVDKFKLSDDYVSFFHRLEKANTVYEKVITSKTTDLNKIINKGILAAPVEETGNWLNFIGIVRKYGLVPLEVMPTSFEGQNSNKVTGLFTEIVRNNCLSILRLKEQKVGLEKLHQKKVEFLEEHYAFLSKVYGEPVCNFDYEYLNRSGQKRVLKNISPKQFIEKFLSIDIENFILVSHRPDREYGQKYKNSNFININEMRYIEFVCLNLNEMKKLAVKQLKNGIPVMIGLCIRKFADDYAGVLDTRLYDYDRLLGYKRLKKSYALKTGDTVLHHWMTITGVHIEDGKTIRWKVEDSYGRETKKEGYYVMNDNYFDQYVITIVIDKRYLPKRLLDLYNRKGISEE